MNDPTIILRYEWCKAKAKLNGLKIVCEYSDKIEVRERNTIIYQTDSVNDLLAFLLGYEYLNTKAK